MPTSIAKACNILKQGGIIAYPTETVCGLGCDPNNPQAIKKLISIKQRPWQQGLITIAANWEQIKDWISDIPTTTKQEITSESGTPTTWLLPAAPDAPKLITGTHQRIAIRFTTEPQLKELCTTFGSPIISTSANHHNKPPCTDLAQTKITFGNTIDYYLDLNIEKQNKPSTIKDAITQEVIRP